MAFIDGPISPHLVLPWKRDPGQEKKFEQYLKRVGVILLILFVLMPWLPVFEAELKKPEKEVETTKVLLKEVKRKPPKPVAQPKPKPKPKPKPPKAKKAKAKPKPSAAPPAPKKAAPAQRTKADIQKASGLSALSGQLRALRGNVNVAGMTKKEAYRSNKGQEAVSQTSRLGVDQATSSIAGVKVDDRIAPNSSTSLAGHSATVVEQVVPVDFNSGTTSSYGTSREGQRDTESIRRVFQRSKGKFDNLVNQYRQQDSNFGGKFVFTLVIEPDGRVSRVKLVSSELGIPQLDKRLLEMVRQLNFGKDDVEPTSVQYTFNFI